MVRLRRCQEAIIKEYHPADEIRCPVHFCIGQEAVPAALSQLLRPADHLLSHHRTHGYYFAKGGSMKALLSELYGRETGANGGIAGSQEISVQDVNFCSGAILTGAMAIAVGVGFALKAKKEGNVAVAGFGDGATDQGVFWEAINYAILRKLPVVFVCENNRYATYSSQFKRQAKENISEKIATFGMRVQSIFGNDVILVHSVISDAIERSRAGKGPSFIEAFTYRLNAHVGPEDDDYLEYRPKPELDFWKINCPITLLEEQMIAHNLLNSVEKRTIISEIDKEICDAFAFAKISKFPNVLNWGKLNYSTNSLLADRLLRDIESTEFNQHQKDTIPIPY
jgi:pyruvate dehydrogenase E1 component alpha subunit